MALIEMIRSRRCGLPLLILGVIAIVALFVSDLEMQMTMTDYKKIKKMVSSDDIGFHSNPGHLGSNYGDSSQDSSSHGNQDDKQPGNQAGGHIIDTQRVLRALESCSNESNDECKATKAREFFKEIKAPPYTHINEYFYKDGRGIPDSVKEEFLINGVGMEPFTTEDGKMAWRENGVEFRPFPFREKADNLFYTSDFEPNIPFDANFFFEGNQSKVIAFNMVKEFSKDSSSYKKIICKYQGKSYEESIRGLDPLRYCPDLPCVITTNRNHAMKSDALIMNGHFIGSNPPERPRGQVWIYYQVEPQIFQWTTLVRFRNSIVYRDVFNWTMSFRRNSDIQYFYGLIRKRRVFRQRDYLQITQRKNKMASWMILVGKSESKRDDYVEELRLHNVTVDRVTCPRNNETECKMVLEEYKFYISFENSFYDSYVTEKFFKNFNFDVILIARGIEEYSNIAPPEIFIDTNDFKSIKDVADKIKYLDSNDEAYAEMLKKKDEYFSIYEDHFLSNNYLETRYEEVSFCQICQRLWNIDRYAKRIPDIDAWFLETKSHLPTDI